MSQIHCSYIFFCRITYRDVNPKEITYAAWRPNRGLGQNFSGRTADTTSRAGEEISVYIFD